MLINSCYFHNDVKLQNYKMVQNANFNKKIAYDYKFSLHFNYLNSHFYNSYERKFLYISSYLYFNSYLYFLKN